MQAVSVFCLKVLAGEAAALWELLRAEQSPAPYCAALSLNVMNYL